MNITDVFSEADLAGRLVSSFSCLSIPGSPLSPSEAPQRISAAVSQVAVYLSGSHGSLRPAVLIIDGVEPQAESMVRETVI
jgi:hypothetical protein